MTRFDRRMQITPVKIARDLVDFDELSRQAHRLTGHFPYIARTLATKRLFHRGHVGTQAGQNLSTTAPRSTKAQFPRLQQNDRVAALGKMQRSGAAGNAAANHADVVALPPGLLRAAMLKLNLECVAVVGCGARRHDGISFSSTLFSLSRKPNRQDHGVPGNVATPPASHQKWRAHDGRYPPRQGT